MLRSKPCPPVPSLIPLRCCSTTAAAHLQQATRRRACVWNVMTGRDGRIREPRAVRVAPHGYRRVVIDHQNPRTRHHNRIIKRTRQRTTNRQPDRRPSSPTHFTIPTVRASLPLRHGRESARRRRCSMQPPVPATNANVTTLLPLHAGATSASRAHPHSRALILATRKRRAEPFTTERAGQPVTQKECHARPFSSRSCEQWPDWAPTSPTAGTGGRSGLRFTPGLRPHHRGRDR
jgi:hypothetical protein